MTAPRTTTVDELVGAYLRRLDRAAASLPPDRRADLLAEIGEHIAAARDAGAAADEAAVRTLLDRLGSPEDIVTAARDVDPPPATAVRPAGTGHELAAVLLLTAGSLVPVVGWLVGVVLLWTSPRWRVREKLLGTLVVPFGPGVVLWGGAFLVVPDGLLGGRELCTLTSTGNVVLETCTSSGPPAVVSVGLLVALVVAPVVVAIVLMRLARRRAALEPAAPVAAAAPWGGLELAGVLVLALGGLLVPVVGPLVGLVLVLCSPRWTRAEKAVAVALTVAFLVAPLVALYGWGVGGIGVMELGGLGVVVGLVLGPALAAIHLVVALQRRR
jgi:hypothetical protein